MDYQYFLRDQALGNATHPPKYKLEYLTFSPEALHPPNDTALAKAWKAPIPRHLLPRSLRNVSRTRSRFAPYRMKDLTIPRWIRLARKLAKREPLWRKFVRFMYMGDEDMEMPLPGYDDDDVNENVDVDVEDDYDDDGDDDDDDDEWEVPQEQEQQWSLATTLNKDEDDLLHM